MSIWVHGSMVEGVKRVDILPLLYHWFTMYKYIYVHGDMVQGVRMTKFNLKTK
jgi:hypothetical protein